MRQKTCKNCKELYTPQKMGQKVCSPECAIALAVLERGKAEKTAQVKERKADAVKRETYKSRVQWASEAQAAVNTFIRVRDEGQPCISCGRHHQGQWHAGHYLSRGARPELRFNEWNIHRQCAPCNTFLSGNAVLYRKVLIEKIGIERVEWLEGPHEPTRYTIDDLKQIKQTYMAKTKQLKEAQ